jgi:hypothetical protein
MIPGGYPCKRIWILPSLCYGGLFQFKTPSNRNWDYFVIRFGVSLQKNMNPSHRSAMVVFISSGFKEKLGLLS